MTLSSYIEDIGTGKFAELYEITQQQAWRYSNLEAAPRPELAFRIVKKTHGLVDWKDIYEPYVKEQNKQGMQQSLFDDLD